MRPLRLMELVKKGEVPKDFAFSFSAGAIRTPTPRAFPFIESHRPQERNRSRSSSRRGSPSRLGRRVLEREFRTGVRQIMSHANTAGAPILFSSLFERAIFETRESPRKPHKKIDRPSHPSPVDSMRGAMRGTVEKIRNAGSRGFARPLLRHWTSLSLIGPYGPYSTSLRLLIGVNVPSSFGRKT